MAILKSFVSAISLYSVIPMPNLTYKDGEDRFSLCFFPLVGLINFFIIKVLMYVNGIMSLNKSIVAVIFMLVPIIITGGIHLDGFMDCMDAVHSYGDQKKRLEILKDPHIGAFCVIKLLELCGLWYVLLMLMDESMYIYAALGFVVSRALSGLSLLLFEPAKKNGMLMFTREHASRKTCIICLIIELLLVFVVMVIKNGVKGIIPSFLILGCFIYYRYKTNKDFGGITGDTAGCFLVMTETCWLLLITVMGFLH